MRRTGESGDTLALPEVVCLPSRCYRGGGTNSTVGSSTVSLTFHAQLAISSKSFCHSLFPRDFASSRDPLRLEVLEICALCFSTLHMSSVSPTCLWCCFDLKLFFVAVIQLDTLYHRYASIGNRIRYTLSNNNLFLPQKTTPAPFLKRQVHKMHLSHRQAHAG